jgi:hypothetical protein
MSIKNIIDGWLNYTMIKLLKTKDPSPEARKHIEDRYNHCSSCPHLKGKKLKKRNIPIMFCNMCGCGFPMLIFAPAKECPAGKWKSMPDDI